MTSTSTFTLTFQNPGEIDIRGALITGLHAKADSESAIGFFGTGLKYAIASIIRWGGVITIYSGLEQHTFSKRSVDFRGQPAEIITHNGADTGFTTAYGKSWQPWMVYRELESNARDEGGAGSAGRQPPIAGQTTIIVKCDALREAWLERQTILLPTDKQPLLSNSRLEIYDEPSDYIYYKGVRVCEGKSSITINLLRDCQLTEDRTLRDLWFATRLTGSLLQTSDNATFLKRIVPEVVAAHGTSSLLGSINFYSDLSFSDEFLKVCKAIYRAQPTKCQAIQSFIDKHAPELTKPAAIALTRHQEHMLAKAKRLVSTMGVGQCEDATITCAQLPNGTLARYSCIDDDIILSPEVFAQGMRALVSTLFEEMLHRHTQKQDCTYDLQTHLFNLVVGLYDEHVWHEGL